MSDEQESTTADEGEKAARSETADAAPVSAAGETTASVESAAEGASSEGGEAPGDEASTDPGPSTDGVIRPVDRPDAPIPIDPGFSLQLPGFEGPLDLLLFLIRKHELDILDLPIAFICEKYAEYITLMEQLNLDVASEYLVMAATLAHIKSKELLPRVPEEQDEDDEDEVDPRAELIRRLLEYQKYKRAAEQLGAFGVAGRDVFPRGIPAPKAEGPAPLAEISVFKLIDAFQRIVKRREGQISLEVDAERVTIQERMSQITEALQARERLSFEELFEGFATTYELVVTFLALLEMAKSRLTRIYQTEPEGPIYLEARILKVEDHGPDDEPTPETLTGQAAPAESASDSDTASDSDADTDSDSDSDADSDSEFREPSSDSDSDSEFREPSSDSEFREPSSDSEFREPSSEDPEPSAEVREPAAESASETDAASADVASRDEAEETLALDPLDPAGGTDQDADGR